MPRSPDVRREVALPARDVGVDESQEARAIDAQLQPLPFAVAVLQEHIPFLYIGEPEIDAEFALDFRALPEGLLTSEVLTASERRRLERIIDDADAVVEADSLDVLGSPPLWFVETVGFIAFELSREHPGAVPPPFPE